MAARLTGEMVVIPGQVSGGRLETPLATLPAPGLAEGPACLGLRPESLSLGRTGAEARVLAARFSGDGHRLRLEAGGATFDVRIRSAPPPPGAIVRVGFDPSDAVVFGPDAAGDVSGRLPSG